MAFVAGNAVGNVIKHSRLHHAPWLVFVVIAALLATVALVGEPRALKRVDIALLGFAMGMVNPVLPKIGAETVSLTFMTGTLSRIGGHLGLALIRAPAPGSEGAWDTQLHRARVDAQLWACFLIGAALSGVAISVSRDYALWPAVAVMLLIALATSYAETREADKGPSTAAEMGPLNAEPIAPPVSGDRASGGRGAERVK